MSTDVDQALAPGEGLASNAESRALPSRRKSPYMLEGRTAHQRIFTIQIGHVPLLCP